ncbi:hypothetical protein HPP92_027704 [Vanilla planifolia]|uniref:Plastid lipid-associated protein/fibrillin conserved domain-containing protein n=1 Tax=Vanilla planifolia TaxID=51239 RepID=A0A835PAU9_VANPL|nr:hypothetical protein HPP92_027704 [Vanilla planifolia]
MAFASLTPVASFPILFRVRDNIQPLAFPVSTSLSHLDSSTRFHGLTHLPMRNHASKLAEPEAVKWRNRVSFFLLSSRKKSREDLKQELFEAIASLDRGAEASPEDQERVEQLPFKAPGSGRGELEITYLDEEIRISRGDKGNLFVLKMVDPSYRVPT